MNIARKRKEHLTWNNGFFEFEAEIEDKKILKFSASPKKTRNLSKIPFFTASNMSVDTLKNIKVGIDDLLKELESKK